MLRRILAVLDELPYSEALTRLGIEWSREFGAELHGLVLIDESVVDRAEPVPLGASYYRRWIKESRRESLSGRAQLLAERFRIQCAKARIRSQVKLESGVAETIVLSESQRYDLILIGRESDFDYGAPTPQARTLHRILRRSARPLVVVPEHVPSARAVLVAFSDELPSARALQMFEALGLHRERRVYILNVSPTRDEAERMCARAADFLSSHRIVLELLPIVSSAPPAEVIQEHVGRLKPGLVVMGAYGRPKVSEIILGSVTRTMLQKCPVPLFLYH